MFSGFVLLLAIGCEGCGLQTQTTVDDELVADLHGGWPDIIIRQPPAFRAFSEGPDSEGWASFYRGDLDDAATQLNGVPLRRVLRERAEIASDLARLAETTFRLTYEAWLETESIGPGSAVPLAAVVAAIDRGDTETSRAWMELIGDYRDPALAAFATNLSPTGLVPEDEGVESIHADCVRAHMQARHSGEESDLTPCDGTVLFSGEGSTAHGPLYNPLQYATAARIEESRQFSAGRLSASEATAPGLEYLLFSRDWNLDDFGASIRGQTVPTLQTYGLDDFSGTREATDEALAWIRQFDQHLDAWLVLALDEAGAEGQQIAYDVQPLEIYRARVLTHQARICLEQEKPQPALTFLNAAVNIDSPRTIGARNRASFYILRAEARLMAGRTREALDDIQIVAEHDPSIFGLRETMNDLSIMQNSTRIGDSKEN